MFCVLGTLTLHSLSDLRSAPAPTSRRPLLLRYSEDRSFGDLPRQLSAFRLDKIMRRIVDRRFLSICVLQFSDQISSRAPFLEILPWAKRRALQALEHSVCSGVRGQGSNPLIGIAHWCRMAHTVRSSRQPTLLYSSLL